MTASYPPRPPGATCPECGRPVPPTGAKLCPSCGYPLLLDRATPADDQPHKISHKPSMPQGEVDIAFPIGGRGPTVAGPPPGPPPGLAPGALGGPAAPSGHGFPMATPGAPPRYGSPPPGAPYPPAPGYGAPPERVRVAGPYCPACRHANPPHRKRCEVCGQELWPGAAYPARWVPPQPDVPAPPRRRRSWLRIAVFTGVTLAAIATVWLLAYLL